MFEQPLVSIVLSTFNRKGTVSLTIESVFSQSYKPIELIIVNDGSTDGSKELLENLKVQLGFTLIHNPISHGLQKSLNVGVKHARGKYIARIDDHDLWIEKDKLTQQVMFLEQHPDVGLLGTGFKTSNTETINPVEDQDIRDQMLFRCPFCHVTVLMRRTVFEEVGGYDEDMRYSEDWDLWLRIGKVSKMKNLPIITTFVTEESNGKSLSNRFFLKQLPMNRMLVRKYGKSYPRRYQAKLYHTFVGIFFSVCTPGNRMHKFMQNQFRRSFLNKKVSSNT